MDRLSSLIEYGDIAELVPAYQDLLARFMLAENGDARREVLCEASELRRDLVTCPPWVAPLIDLHARAQTSLVDRWKANARCSVHEERALAGMARGEALPLLQVLIQRTSPLGGAADSRPPGNSWQTEQAKLIAAFEQAEDLFLILDAHGAIESVNAAFSRSTGWSAMQALTLSEAMWKGPLPLQEPEHLQLEQRRSDGSSFRVDWLVSPVRGPEGSVISHVCVGRDLARQQRIADELRENDKLRALATLSAGIAHDFNNLLGAINGLAELCEQDAPAGSRQARNLGRIRQAGTKAAVLVRRMLDFARMSPRTVEPVAAFALVEETAELLRASLPERVSMTVELLQDSDLKVDGSQIQQVLLNLGNNAVHAMRERGGNLRIVVDHAWPLVSPSNAQCQQFARIRVIDCGEGMVAEVLARIFDPFFTTKPVGEGTGLGLSAAHGIVGSHGGQIEVDSSPGRGSVFSVFLPFSW